MGEERLPQRVMFGELVGGKGYSGQEEEDWLVHLKEDIVYSLIGYVTVQIMSVCGMNIIVRRVVAKGCSQKAGR